MPNVQSSAIILDLGYDFANQASNTTVRNVPNSETEIFAATHGTASTIPRPIGYRSSPCSICYNSFGLREYERKDISLSFVAPCTGLCTSRCSTAWTLTISLWQLMLSSHGGEDHNGLCAITEEISLAERKSLKTYSAISANTV